MELPIFIYVIVLILAVFLLFLDNDVFIIIILIIRIYLEIFSLEISNTKDTYEIYQTFNFNALVSLLIIFKLIYQFLFYSSKFKLAPFFPIIIIFLLYILFNIIFFSYNKKIAFFDLVRILSYISIYLLSYNIENDYFYKNFKKYFLLAVIPTVSYSYYQMFEFNFMFLTNPNYRISSFFVNANSFGFFLLIPLTFSLLEFLSKTKITKLIYIFFIFIPIVATNVRLALGCAILTFALSSIFHKKKYYLVIIIIITFLLLYSLPALIQRIEELTIDNPEKSSLAIRLLIWEGNIYHFLKNPLMGMGFKNSFVMSRDFIGDYFLTHNDYLRILVETGIIGIFNYLLIKFLLINKLFKIKKNNNSELNYFLIILFVNFSLIEFFDNIFTSAQLNYFFWSLLGFHFKQYYKSFNKI